MGFEHQAVKIVGVCPRCGRNVLEQKLSYSCESGRDGCGFTLWKKDRYKNISISTAQAEKLLSEGKTKLNAVNKAGKKYYAEFKLEDTGKYVNLVYIAQNVHLIGKCPKCGADIKSGQNGCYCSGKCGMNVGKVYGRELTAEQVKALLTGKKLTLFINGRKTVVKPEYVENEYKGKIYFQWGTE